MTTPLRLFTLSVLFSPALALFIPALALGDGAAQAQSQPNAAPREDSAPSANYDKTGLLPGEEVRTPTGKTIKVWTTEGPVSVSPAPEPFDKPQPTVDSVGVIVDGRRLREPRVPNDTFDVGAPRTPDAPRVPPGAYPNVGTGR